MNNTNFETYFETKWKAVLVETYSQEEAKRIYDYSMYRIGRVQLKAYQMCKAILTQWEALDIIVFSECNDSD